MKEHKTTPEMKLFFDRLLGIKKFVKEAADEKDDPFLFEIYEKLHALIKSEDEQVSKK